MKLLSHKYNHTDIQKLMDEIIGNPTLVLDSDSEMYMYSQREIIYQNGKPFQRVVYYSAIRDKKTKKIKQKQIISVGDYSPCYDNESPNIKQQLDWIERNSVYGIFGGDNHANKR